MTLDLVTRAELDALRQQLGEDIAELQAQLARLKSPAVSSPWMTAKEVCRYFCISRTTLRNRVKAGKLIVHYPDGLARFARAEVEKL